MSGCRLNDAGGKSVGAPVSTTNGILHPRTSSYQTEGLVSVLACGDLPAGNEPAHARAFFDEDLPSFFQASRDEAVDPRDAGGEEGGKELPDPEVAFDDQDCRFRCREGDDFCAEESRTDLR